jgi:polyisoprenoid-binding protein YceI
MSRVPFMLVSLAFLVTVRPSLAEAVKYEIDSAHTAAEFSVRHMMISDVKGTFSKVSGAVEYDEKNPQDSKVDATIDVASIDTREPHRDEHLKTAPDFLDAAKYPTMTFKSKKVIAASKGHLQVIGDLNLHGVTKEVTLDVDGPTAEISGGRRGASATTKINRKDFGVTWNKALDNGGVTVGDEVNITIDIEMKKPKAKA